MGWISEVRSVNGRHSFRTSKDISTLVAPIGFISKHILKAVCQLPDYCFSLQRVPVPPVPLACGSLPRLLFECWDIAPWSDLLLDPTDHSPQVAPASGMRLPLDRRDLLPFVPPWRLASAEDEAVNGTLQT